MGEANQAVTAIAERSVLKKQMFEKLDRDGDGFLNKEETAVFIKIMGFDGSEEELAEEYSRMCEEHGGLDPLQGIPEAVIMQLLDDESDDGCYSTEEDLVRII